VKCTNQLGDTEHNDTSAVSDVALTCQCNGSAAVSLDIYNIAKQVMTGTATVGAETKLRLINSRIPEHDFKFPARIYRDIYVKYEVMRRYCARDWLHSHDYLAYSKLIDSCSVYAVLCFLCRAKLVTALSH
jgi:hypothetical protein